MKILIACEESQIMCKAFRERGHEAYSCDLKDCSGGHPEWHIKDDVTKVLSDSWDMMIAHPPCTHLALSGAMHFAKKRADGRQQSSIDFFLLFTQTKIPKVCIENPMGIMSKLYRKPDQIIHPYHFGHPAQKTTCLCLKGLKKLVATHFDAPLFGETVDKGEFKEWICKKTGKKKIAPSWHFNGFKKGMTETYDVSEERMVTRSFRFPLIAKAMAEQWS